MCQCTIQLTYMKINFAVKQNWKASNEHDCFQHPPGKHFMTKHQTRVSRKKQQHQLKLLTIFNVLLIHLNTSSLGGTSFCNIAYLFPSHFVQRFRNNHKSHAYKLLPLKLESSILETHKYKRKICMDRCRGIQYMFYYHYQCLLLAYY